ncbi:cell wall-binding repeat-containing protein [Clostridium scatologenes]|uniref:Cell wall binding repeat 2 family protein n=1 Tax=Clostridium scatologenes TaxID=1548 RepID=A0A0E3M997_CLOSL|nr:cell wall-binding repeat-containing protein [Clostridium scatologenes]AKA69365.1 cell wall binding repeat 2 family protein [Clostridium scatologenes]
MKRVKNKVLAAIMSAMIFSSLTMARPLVRVYASEANPINNVTINTNISTNQVTIQGSITSGSGKNVTIQVLDPNGSIDYIGQTVSSENGKFIFTFKSNNAVSGSYNAKIGGEEVTAPYQQAFSFSGGSSGGRDSSDSSKVPSPTANFQRISGADRMATSIAIAKEQFSSKQPDAVVLASGNDFPDALGGSGLAYKNNAPILLVGNSVNDSKAVFDYIANNLSKDKKIYALGGTASVSQEIFNYMTAQGYNLIRIGGKDRYETNKKIVDNLNVDKGTPIVITSGNNFADALSISSIASIKGYPILINDKDNLMANVGNYITSIQPSTIYVVGGTGVISANIETQIKNLNGNINIIRLGGQDRYETSTLIAEKFNLNTNIITIASGLNFPDALSGSVLAARKNSSVLLVDNNDVSRQKQLLNKQKITNVIVLGGEGSIKSSTVNSLLEK